MDVVYVDELFVLNALTDYLLLLLSARVRGAPLRRGRYALAGVLGGLYAAAAALPALSPLRSPVCAAGASLLLCLVSFGTGADLWRGWGAFLALSALFAGAVYALSRVPERGGAVSFRALLVSFGGCYAAVSLFLGRAARRKERRVLPVEVVLLGRRAAFSALRDTGNALADPISGVRVLVAGAGVLRPLFPLPLPSPVPGDAAALCRLLASQPGLSSRLRLVPYAAVGTERGLLVCFRPDLVRVEGEARELLIGVSPSDLGDGTYDAVL